MIRLPALRRDAEHLHLRHPLRLQGRARRWHQADREAVVVITFRIRGRFIAREMMATASHGVSNSSQRAAVSLGERSSNSRPAIAHG
jgi:hypothetical protein